MGDNRCVTSRLADILPLDLGCCSLYTLGESIQVMFYELVHFVYKQDCHTKYKLIQNITNLNSVRPTQNEASLKLVNLVK